MFKYSAVIVQLIFVHLISGMNIESIDSANGSKCKILTCSNSSLMCRRTVEITDDTTITTETCSDEDGGSVTRFRETTQNIRHVKIYKINPDNARTLEFDGHLHKDVRSKTPSQFSAYSIIMQFFLLCILSWRLYH